MGRITKAQAARGRVLGGALAGVALAFACVGVTAPRADAPDDATDWGQPETATRVPGEVIVRFRAGAGTGERRAARTAVGAAGAKRLPLPQAEVVRLREGESVRAAVRWLERRRDVLYAEPNFVRTLHA